MKRISILGSTGSIGRQTLQVARWRGYEIVGLAAGRNSELLIKQAHEFRPELVSCDDSIYKELKAGVPSSTRVSTHSEALAGLEHDVIVAAIPGIAGLSASVAAAKSGRRVALAHKEAMVIAGPLIWEMTRASGSEIIPVDSEHSALFQCLQGETIEAVDKLVLTASGGPFLHGPKDLSKVTPAQALEHPNWSMGQRITIDSATLFNKGLEVLEAHFLYDIPLADIEVVVHPQSLIHGLLRFKDGSIKAQIGPHDMRLPIQYAIEYPERPSVPLKPLPLVGSWELYEPDLGRFPSLELAYRAGKLGGLAPTYLNAADEVAVAAFLAGTLRFDAIPEVLLEVLEHTPDAALSWEAIQTANETARALAKEACKKRFKA